MKNATAVLFSLICGLAYADNPLRVADEGATLTRRNKLNFTGNDVSCVDNSGAKRTDCTIAHDLNRLPVLNFPGAYNNVSSEANCGKYWAKATNLGASFYEYWYRPNDGCDSAYVIADGAGGSHAELIGCNQPTPGASNIITVTGNMANSTPTSFSFGTDIGCYPGEWCHVGHYYDNNGMQYVYINGVLAGRATAPAANTRQSPSVGGGPFLVGGSDHSNGNFAIAQLRGVEGTSVIPAPLKAYAPQTRFTNTYWDNSTTWTNPSIWLDFTRAGLMILDLSSGYGGRTHSCAVTEARYGVDEGFPYNPRQAYPTPTWEYDNYAPVNLSSAPTPRCLGPTSPASVPGGAKIFDSFTRSGCDSTYAFDNQPVLGSTEGGSLGVLAWSTGRIGSSGAVPRFGYQKGRAIFPQLAGDGDGVAWVANNSADATVQVDRFEGTYNSGYTGIAYHVVDKDNFNFCFTEGSASAPAVRCGAAVSGTLTVADGQGDYTSYSTSATWTTLRVVTSGTTHTIYTCATNSCSSPTQIGQLTSQTTNQSGTGFGLIDMTYNVTDVSSDWTADNFAVF